MARKAILDIRAIVKLQIEQIKEDVENCPLPDCEWCCELLAILDKLEEIIELTGG